MPFLLMEDSYDSLVTQLRLELMLEFVHANLSEFKSAKLMCVFEFINKIAMTKLEWKLSFEYRIAGLPENAGVS